MNEFLGKQVIIRAYSAGNFYGKLIKQEADVVILENARRLWYWKAAQGISLSAVAENGVDPTKSRFPNSMPLVQIFGVIEIIPASEKAQKSIEETPNDSTI